MLRATTTATPRERTTLWTPAFTVLAFASLAYFTANGMLLPALPRYVQGPLGGGNVAVGVVFGAFGVSAVLLRPAVGIFSDRRGRRPLMLAGAALFAVSVLAYGLTTTPGTLAVLRFLGGAGEAMFFVGMVTTFVDLAPAERRGEAMSLASLALYLGIGLGPVLAEVTIARLGLTAVWVLAAALGLVAVLFVANVPETRPVEPAGRAPSTRTTGGSLVHPAGLLPGLVLLASIVGMAGFLAFVPLHALDIGMAGSSVVLAAFGLVVVLVRSVGARLPDLLGPGRAIRVALTLSVVGLVVVGTWHAPLGLVLGGVVLAIGIALLTPSVFALAVADVAPGERGQVLATTSAFIDIAFAVGPMSMGLIAAAHGRAAVFLAGAAVAGAGLALTTATRLGRRDQPRHAAGSR